MKRLFAAIDVDYDQWWALTRTAVRIDLRASSFMRAQFGQQAKAAGAIIGQILFYTLMGGFIAAFVWVSQDLFLSATTMITYIVFMVGTATLLDHNAAFVSPDDHGILGYRPITSRTYFAARLANVLVYTLGLTTLFSYLPIGAYFIRWGFLVGLAAIGSVYGSALAIALTMIVVYAGLLRLIGPARIKRVLSYVQFALSFTIYGGYFFLMRLVSTKAMASFTLDKSAWMLILPSTWFASYIEIAGGRTSWMELVPAGLSVVFLAGIARALGGRLSLDYAERLSAIAIAAAPKRAARPASRRASAWFARGEARAVSLLIRSQFANDMKFRMGVLAILPLTLLYLFLGVSEHGTVGDPFVRDKSGEGLRLVTLAMLMFPTMLKMNLGRSDAFRASWIFFACPMDRPAMVRAAKNVLVTWFLLPYLVVIGLVLTYFTTNPVHLFVHLIVIGLLSHLALQIVTFVDPELPFSKPMQKMRSSTRVFMVVMVIGIGGAVLPFLAPLVYRSTAAIGITLAALVGVSLLVDRMTRLRVEAQAAALEFEG